MAMTIWNELSDMERRMDEFFKEVSWPRPGLHGTKSTSGRFFPAVDVLHRDGDLVVRAELPGMDPAKDVKVTLSEGELVISGERTEQTEVKEEAYHRRETSFGSFERHLVVPAGIEASKISATYKDGVLEVVVTGGGKPAAASRGKEIPIKVTAAK
jgi:HSP20 family protein